MQFLLVLLIASCVSYSSCLVHFLKLAKGQDGCKTEDGEELQVGQFMQDMKTCGALKCISKEGDALIFYCQRILPFTRCESDKVTSKMDFPVCCWTCVQEEDCDKDGNPIAKKKEVEEDKKKDKGKEEGKVEG